MMLLGRQNSIATQRSTAFAWRPLLKELSEFRLADPKLSAGLPEQYVKAQWLGEPARTTWKSKSSSAASAGACRHPTAPF